MVGVLAPLETPAIDGFGGFPEEVWVLRHGRAYGLVCCCLPIAGHKETAEGIHGLAVFSTENYSTRYLDHLRTELDGFEAESVDFESAIVIAKQKHETHPEVKAVCLCDRFPHFKLQDVQWIA